MSVSFGPVLIVFFSGFAAPQLPDDTIMKYEEELDNLVELTTVKLKENWCKLI